MTASFKLSARLLKPEPHTIPTSGVNNFSGSLVFKLEYVDSSRSMSDCAHIVVNFVPQR